MPNIDVIGLQTHRLFSDLVRICARSRIEHVRESYGEQPQALAEARAEYENTISAIIALARACEVSIWYRYEQGMMNPYDEPSVEDFIDDELKKLMQSDGQEGVLDGGDKPRPKRSRTTSRNSRGSTKNKTKVAARKTKSKRARKAA